MSLPTNTRGSVWSGWWWLVPLFNKFLSLYPPVCLSGTVQMCPRPVRMEASSCNIFLTRKWQLYDNKLRHFLLCLDSCSYAMIGKRGGCNTCLTWLPCTLEPVFFGSPGRGCRGACVPNMPCLRIVCILIYTGAHLYMYENVHTHIETCPARIVPNTALASERSHACLSTYVCILSRAGRGVSFVKS